MTFTLVFKGDAGLGDDLTGAQDDLWVNVTLIVING